MFFATVHYSKHRLKSGNSKNEGVTEQILPLPQTGVSMQSTESKQELSLSIAFLLVSERAASAGKVQGNRQIHNAWEPTVIELQPQTLKYKREKKGLISHLWLQDSQMC